MCTYGPLGFLSGARTSDLRFIGFERDADDRRTVKLVNSRPVEKYGWDRQGRLAWFYDVAGRAACWFAYEEDERLPRSVERYGELGVYRTRFPGHKFFLRRPRESCLTQSVLPGL